MITLQEVIMGIRSRVAPGAAIRELIVASGAFFTAAFAFDPIGGRADC
jgi:hypothetical protein